MKKRELVASHTVRALILGAGRGEVKEERRVPPPMCLLTDLHGSRVLDWILSALRYANIHDITFVGGYRIEEVGEKYPDLSYIYNPEWETSGVLESFYNGKEVVDCPLLVSYADIVYHPDVCKKLIENSSSMITIAIDSKWIRREKGLVDSPRTRKNLVIVTDDHVSDIGFLPVTNEVAGEFIGLTYFAQDSIPLLSSFLNEEFPELIGKPFQQARDVRYGSMTDLLRYFMKKNVDIKVVDIGAEWAEIDGPASLARFVFGTKSETLNRLTTFIKMGRFCKQQVFTVGMWQDDRDSIVSAICEEFSPDHIAIRSSASAEDSWEGSSAGTFTSVLNVDSFDSSSITHAIDRVVSSYTKNGREENRENQVLVQKMVQDVVMSGVVFTRDLDSGAPYYVINYDDITNQTDSVTRGNSSQLRTVLVSRAYAEHLQDPRLGKLLGVVREIEHMSGCNALDIEFAIDIHEEIYVLQVRIITVIPQETSFHKITNLPELNLIRSFLSQRFLPVPYLYGKTTILGDMPDWNPAEMIGTSPKPLALSLYNYLIMDSTWRVARARIGYHNPEPASLMVCLAGHPYVDVRCSFNSLLPERLPDAVAEKLINHYLERLRANPNMHDKVEFEICFTCLDFDYSHNSKRLVEDCLTKDEVSTIRAILCKLTDNIISGRIVPFAQLVAELDMLQVRNQQTLNIPYELSGIPIMISQLLDDCIKYGTIPFSILARYAFIANSLLRSLLERGVLTQERYDVFLCSVDSVATQLVRDVNAVISGGLSKNVFLKVYGHLRPGTYDITSLRYDESPDSYFKLGDFRPKLGLQRSKPEPFSLKIRERKEIGALIKENGFTFSVDTMFGFMKKAISLREHAKFEFTKTVSEILVLLCRLGKEYNISREDLSYLSIDTIRRLGSNVYASSPHSLLAAEIAAGWEWYEHTRMVRLPHLITNPQDIDIIEIPVSRPNYVTSKKVVGHLVVVDRKLDPSSLRDKIAMMKSADSGFDWIFAHGIAGLITMYGGAASHMTIRASEFNIPAAIGCGEGLFNRLLKANVVELNCAEKYIVDE